MYIVAWSPVVGVDGFWDYVVGLGVALDIATYAASPPRGRARLLSRARLRRVSVVVRRPRGAHPVVERVRTQHRLASRDARTYVGGARHSPNPIPGRVSDQITHTASAMRRIAQNG